MSNWCWLTDGHYWVIWYHSNSIIHTIHTYTYTICTCTCTYMYHKHIYGIIYITLHILPTLEYSWKGTGKIIVLFCISPKINYTHHTHSCRDAQHIQHMYIMDVCVILILTIIINAVITIDAWHIGYGGKIVCVEWTHCLGQLWVCKQHYMHFA